MKIIEFIEINYILSNNQYGFRSSMSTSHALLDLIEEISTSLDRNWVSSLTYKKGL